MLKPVLVLSMGSQLITSKFMVNIIRSWPTSSAKREVIIFPSRAETPLWISGVKYPSVSIVGCCLEEHSEMIVSKLFFRNDPEKTANGSHKCFLFKIPCVGFAFFSLDCTVHRFSVAASAGNKKSLQSLYAIKWTFLQHQYTTISVWCKLFDSAI